MIRKRKQTRKKREASFGHGLFCLSVVAFLMFFSTFVWHGGPQLPLMAGCVVSGLIASLLGFRWEKIQESMLHGISQSLEALLILLLIGCLAGVWIISGAVPSMIYYGLGLLSARSFLPLSFLICGAVSLAIGAWGTVGTVGIAFMGIGSALGLPSALAAGCIVSGAYFGDAVSPLSDATNMTAAVVGKSTFSVIRSRIPPVCAAFLLSCLFYYLLGLRYGFSDPSQAESAVLSLRLGLEHSFFISPLALLPVLAMLTCILLKAPAIPSMLVGILAGAAAAVLLQGCSAATVFAVCAEGNSSSTGNALLDSLLTAGGISSMMNTVSIVLIAMAFGGLMQGSGQMQALVAPLTSRIRRFRWMNLLAAFLCIAVDLLLPDQYLGISVPGQMLAEEYDRRGYRRESLSVALTVAAVSSPLVPWNTCGLYCLSLLGVSAAQYLPFACFGLLTTVFVVIFGFSKKAE